MKVQKTEISGLLIIKQNCYQDDRGYFTETWNKKSLKEAGLKMNFVQDNLSFSKKNVLRGLHFQNPPFEQGKLVRVLAGSVLDVAVDIRKHSLTYGKYFSMELSGENNLALWIPPGFAHGFLSLEDNTLFSYKCTNYYNPLAEDSILWNDPVLNINWNNSSPLLSPKDAKANFFSSLESLF